MTPRLKTALWVQVQVRLCDRDVIPIAVSRKGDPDAGSILLKLARREKRCLVLRRITTLDGDMGWMVVAGDGEVPEDEAQAYVEREMERDRDLWIIEIEDPEGRYELDGPVET